MTLKSRLTWVSRRRKRTIRIHHLASLALLRSSNSPICTASVAYQSSAVHSAHPGGQVRASSLAAPH